MALKLKKEIKKSSYYVWFLGAKESKGLRGLEYILPVIDNLEEREKEIEPFKVTLQVSSKGLKIVQNIVSSQNNKKPKNETIKHFIPHNTITCVHQREDVIACILLLFNPVTKCPLHVHAYRCDSLETATMLKGQLQMLIEKPENQKKFAEIESRLMPSTGMGIEDRKEGKGGKKDRLDSSIGSSDTGTSTKSESSEERFSSDVRVATLYDSVAAELRAKLNKNDVPILLPPRDYDTVHRQKGNLTGIELRRCLNVNIVGQNGKTKRMASSGDSSGIGSDHAPSPESPDVQERYHDGHSTSDEDWNADQDTGLYLIDQPTYPSPLPKYDYRAEQRKPRQFDQRVTRQHLEEHIRKKLEQRNKFHGQEAFNYLSNKDDSSLNRNTQYRNERNKDYNREYNKEYSREYPDRFSYETIEDTLKRQTKGGQKEERSSREGRYSERYAEVQKESGRYQDRIERVDRDDRGDRVDKRQDRIVRPRDTSPGNDTHFQDTFNLLQFSPRERFNDAKEKFLLLEKKTGISLHQNQDGYFPREMPISPNISNKDKRNSRYYDDEPIPAPRNLKPTSDRNTNSHQALSPLERYRSNQEKVDKYDMKRRSMFNLSTSSNSNNERSLNDRNQGRAQERSLDRKERSLEKDRDYYYHDTSANMRDSRDIREDIRKDCRTLNKDYKRRSYMEQSYRERENDFEAHRGAREHRRDDKEFKEFKEAKENKYWDCDDCPDFRDGREGIREIRELRDARDGRDTRGDREVMLREKKFTPNQRYRNSYAEPSLQDTRKYPVAGGRTRFDVLHRTNSTVSNNGRVGIASVHPY